MGNGPDVPGSVTIAQNGASVTASYDDGNGTISTLAFTAVGDVAATLASPQTFRAKSALLSCTVGPLEIVSAAFDAASGVLTYDAGTLFLSLAGATVPDDPNARPCNGGKNAATITFVCSGGGAPAKPPTNAPAFPTGTYACRATTVGSSTTSTGSAVFVAGGDKGTLTIAPSGANVAATYGGDFAASGTIEYAPTSSISAARVGNDQRFEALCAAPPSSGTVADTHEPLLVTASTMALAGETLFLSVAGTFGPFPGSSAYCPGAAIAGSLACTKQ